MTTIPLPWTTPPLTGNRTRGNPIVHHRKFQAARAEAVAAIVASGAKWRAGCNVTLHLRVATRRKRDADGLFPTLKACQDALVVAEVISEDSWVTVPRASCEIHPPDGRPAAMWLELGEVDE